MSVTALDRALSISAVLGVVVLFVGTAWLWPQLPDVVPIHFGPSGRPDGWGDRATILELPAVGLGMYLLFSVILRLPPRLYNFPWPITDENRERQFLLARRTLLAFRAYVVFVFVVLLLCASRVALGQAQGLGGWFLPVSLGVLVLMLVSYFVLAWRAR